MSRILPSAIAYRVQHGHYWAVVTKAGFGWILDRQVAPTVQPGVFTKAEADHLQRQFPDCTIHHQQPYSDIPNTQEVLPPKPFDETAERLICHTFSYLAKLGEQRGLTKDEVANFIRKEVETYLYLPAPKKPSIWGKQKP